MADVIIDTTRLGTDLAGRRWFGGRDRTITGVSVIDSTVIEDGPPALVVALLSLRLGGGDVWLYHTVLVIDSDGSARDAIDEPDRLRVLGELMAHGHTLKGDSGNFHFGGPGLDPLAPPGKSSVRVMDSEQSNSSVVLDEDVIVKIFRRVESGTNPDLELNRLLTNEGFEHVPPQVGEILYEGEIDGVETSIDLGIAQRFVSNAREGWAEVLHHLNLLYDEVHAEDVPEDMRALTEQRAEPILRCLDELGEATASLHLALAREEIGPDFVPEPIDESALHEWSVSARQRLERLIAAEDLGLEAAAVEERINSVAQLSGDLGHKIRIHGDYHLGQALYGKRNWMIIDFEGEPTRSLEVRREKQCALKDVAGMLRSFEYAAMVSVFERAEKGTADWDRLELWATAWEDLARERFLASYLRRSHEGRFLPADREILGIMLDFFEIDKAIYELDYERGHRPHWAWIPRRGIERLLARGS
jgi:maltose alpha-D-glucosyltransferase/alpha-amylase